MRIYHFEEIEAWKKSQIVAIEIYKVLQLNYTTQQESNQLQKDLVEISLLIKGFIRVLDKSGYRLN